MYEKRAPKGLQMGDFISGVSALGRSWGTFGAPVRFLTLKMSPKCPQELQITPKVTPKKPKSAKSDFKSAPESRNGKKQAAKKMASAPPCISHFLGAVSAGRVQHDPARRTARSALNKVSWNFQC